MATTIAVVILRWIQSQPTCVFLCFFPLLIQNWQVSVPVIFNVSGLDCTRAADWLRVNIDDTIISRSTGESRISD